MIITIDFKKTFWGGSLFLLAASIFLFSGCLKEETPPSAQEILQQRLDRVDKTLLAADLAVIDDSLAIWGLTDEVLTEPNGVRYRIETQGTGVQPSLESIIRIRYSGKLFSTGAEFDSAERADFFLYDLITGFQTTLPLVPVGSVVTLYIPSGYGYGSNDSFDQAGNVLIPGNSILIFDIELLEAY